MASGGIRRRVDQTAPVDDPGPVEDGVRVDDATPVGHRSRTGQVIDTLLSRGPVIGRPSGARGGADPWASVSPVLRATAPSVVEGHLTWLVNATVPDDHLSPWRIAVEDQARILIRALDERSEDDAVTRALERSWTVDAVGDDDDVATYVSALRAATRQQPQDSPYAALARSAGAFAAGILDHRRSSTRRRRLA